MVDDIHVECNSVANARLVPMVEEVVLAFVDDISNNTAQWKTDF